MKKENQPMATNLRLSKEEQRQLELKCREINKILVVKEFPPMNESTLAHKILEKTIKKVEVNNSGELIIGD
jgi:hypothetical protein